MSPISNGGSPIIGYDVERREVLSGRWLKLTKSPVKVLFLDLKKLLIDCVLVVYFKTFYFTLIMKNKNNFFIIIYFNENFVILF